MTNMPHRIMVPSISTSSFHWRRNNSWNSWIYTGRLTRDGYASVFYQGRMAPLHRIFYEHFIDKIPQGLEPDHLCRVRCCENPWHLEIVSRLENTMRGNSVPAINARKTHCKYGHPFSGRNLHIRSDGSRSCRMCLANKE